METRKEIKGRAMRIFTATTRTQGERPNDFCFVPEGEVLMPGFECDGETVDGGCGCRRALTGVECLRATTTMQVMEVPQDAEWLVDVFARALRRAGFRLNRRDVRPDVERLLGLATAFETGTVVERRGDAFKARK